jgi:putative component of membrane protein insertase Oxa1/YidC/SpoIIIJ protein YidD
MIGSVRLNGAILGALDGIRRLLKCHPFHPGGVDEPKRIELFGKRTRCRTG